MRVEVIPSSIQPPTGAPRSEGIHVSRVLRAIAAETGVLKKEWVDLDSLSLYEVSQEEFWRKLDPASQLRMSIGLAWEEWYIPQLGHVVKHPGEMCVEGIYMTHDGESLDVVCTPGRLTQHQWWCRKDPCTCSKEFRRTHAVRNAYALCLHEVKATYKSVNTVGDLSTQWLWVAQTKAYCKGLGTLTAYLHVLFLCGDYKYPITPQLKVWKVTYSQEEIEDNWDLITSYVAHQQNLELEGEA